MSDDDEFRRVAEIERAANGKRSYVDMDAAFCARMYAAITAGLESAPTAVVITPGTQNPKYRFIPPLVAPATGTGPYAGLNANHARSQLPEERKDIATLQLPTNNHLAVSTNAMDLKNRFRNVETDCDRLHV